MTDPSLTLTAAVKTYGDLVALDRLDLTVGAGQIHAIVGLNGAGKTTAMQALVGHVALDSGDARLCGKPIDSAVPTTLARLGYVIGAPFGYRELTCRKTIGFACRLHGWSATAAAAAADAWLTRLELDAWGDRPARGLSLGNRQRLGLACALAHEPDVIILDEPTNALDPAGVIALRDLLVEVAGRGAATLVSSHHLDEVSRVADAITVIHAGQVVGPLAPGQPDLERAFFSLVHDWDARHRDAARLGSRS